MQRVYVCVRFYSLYEDYDRISTKSVCHKFRMYAGADARIDF